MLSEFHFISNDFEEFCIFIYLDVILYSDVKSNGKFKALWNDAHKKIYC